LIEADVALCRSVLLTNDDDPHGAAIDLKIVVAANMMELRLVKLLTSSFCARPTRCTMAAYQAGAV
jgi:hypothetical protein